jgi:hypothetical protein
MTGLRLPVGAVTGTRYAGGVRDIVGGYRRRARYIGIVEDDMHEQITEQPGDMRSMR